MRKLLESERDRETVENRPTGESVSLSPRIEPPGMWTIGKIEGMPVSIHPAFPLVLLGLAILGLGIGRTDLVPSIFLGGICLALREVAHAVIAKRSGYPMQRVMIHPLRSSVLLKAERKPYDECKIAVAGPLVSGALAFLLWGYLALSGAPLLQTVRMKLIPGGDVCSDLLLMNGLLFAGSLIPALPLEGGRMIRSVLSRYWGRQRATMVVAQCSLFVAFALMLLAAFTATALWALLSLVIAIGSTREAQMALYRNQIQGKVVRAAMQPTLRSLKPGDSIGLAEKYLSFDGQQSFPVVLGTDVVGVLAGNRIRDGISRLGRNAYISEIMDRGVVCVGPDQSLEMVLVVVQNIERTPIIVMEEGKVVGMLTHSSVSEFFARSS